MLCSSPVGKQHPGTFPHSFLECHRCLHQMVAWKTGSTGLSLTCAMVPYPQSPATIEEILATVAFPNARTSSSMPHSILQDGLYQARCCSRSTLQSQKSHRRLVYLESSDLLLSILVILQIRCSQSFRLTLGPIRLSPSLLASTRIGSDSRRILIQQSFSFQKGISNSDATWY